MAICRGERSDTELMLSRSSNVSESRIVAVEKKMKTGEKRRAAHISDLSSLAPSAWKENPRALPNLRPTTRAVPAIGVITEKLGCLCLQLDEPSETTAKPIGGGRRESKREARLRRISRASKKSGTDHASERANFLPILVLTTQGSYRLIRAGSGCLLRQDHLLYAASKEETRAWR